MEEKGLLRIEIRELVKLETTAFVELDDSAIPVSDSDKYADDEIGPIAAPTNIHQSILAQLREEANFFFLKRL